MGRALSVLAVVLALLAGAPAAVPAPPIADAATYARDANAFSAALDRFAQRLQAADSRAEFLRAVPAMRRDLRAQGRAVDRMAGYRLESPVLERRRAAVVRAARPVVVTGRAFVNAVVSGDAARVRRVGARYQRLLGVLRRAFG